MSERIAATRERWAQRVIRNDSPTRAELDDHDDSPPFITLNNGIELPALGLGVFQSPQAETVTAVESALAAGYRLIRNADPRGVRRQ